MKLYNSKGAIGGIMNKDKVILKMMDYQGNSIDFISTGETKETRLVCRYNVTQTTGATQLLSKYVTLSEIASMEVDGVNTTVATGYTFTTTGEHTVKFTLKDSTTIGDNAFFRCESLTSVTIGSGVTSIGNIAFNGCKNLTSVVIPDSVTSIGNEAFEYCDGLTSVTIGSGVTSIGFSAFNNTPWYKSCSADTANQYGNIIYINNVAYQATSTGITSCEFKEGTVGIGNMAFYGCKNLTSVVIPDSVTSIGNEAFNGCTGLTSVTIGSGVTSIGNGAFYETSELSSITYTGTVAQWEAINKGEEWHYDVPSTTKVTCSDGEVTL